MLVTSLSDGLNLVAKEFVASRTDEQGVLILSRRAGAAAELTAALLVDPTEPGRTDAGLCHRTRHGRGRARVRMRRLRAGSRRTMCIAGRENASPNWTRRYGGSRTAAEPPMLTDRPALATILVVDDQEVGQPAAGALARAPRICGPDRHLRRAGPVDGAATSGGRRSDIDGRQHAGHERPGARQICARRIPWSADDPHGAARGTVGRPSDGPRASILPVLAKPLDFDKLLAHLRVMLPPLLPPRSRSLPGGRQ